MTSHSHDLAAVIRIKYTALLNRKSALKTFAIAQEIDELLNQLLQVHNDAAAEYDKYDTDDLGE